MRPRTRSARCHAIHVEEPHTEGVFQVGNTSDTVGADTLSNVAAFVMLPVFATVKKTCRSRNRSRRPIWPS
jgi:hypothetical protein